MNSDGDRVLSGALSPLPWSQLKRDLRIKLKIRGFSPERVFADVVAVIGKEDDHRAICDAGGIQGIKHFAKLRIQK